MRLPERVRHDVQMRLPGAIAGMPDREFPGPATARDVPQMLSGPAEIERIVKAWELAPEDSQ
jgi:hypothetical protein